VPGKEFSPEGAQSFKNALAVQTTEWMNNTPTYTSAPGNEGAYDEMGQYLLERVLRTPGISDEFNGLMSVESGMEVMARFMYAGGAVAALQDFSIGQLKNAMYNYASFNTLSLFTHERQPVAKRVEIPLGLKKVGGVSVDYQLSDFRISEETGLSIPQYGLLRHGARSDAYHQGLIDDDELYAVNKSFCIGQTTGINMFAYKSMLTICLNDPYLYAATLARPTQA